MENRITLNTQYKVKSLFDSSELNNDILISYYLPLIKNESYSLYSFLLFEAKNNAINTIFISIERVIDILDLSIKEIHNSISRLELYNLLDVMADENERLIFCLKKPLAPKEFNESFQLKETLISKIGNKNFEINNMKFNSLKDVNEEGFEIITKGIELSTNANKNKDNSLNVKYNFDSIKSIIIAKGIDWSLFWTDKLESELINLILIYKISPFDIALEIINEYEKEIFNELNLINRIKDNFSKKDNISETIENNETKLDYLKDMSVNEYFVSKLERDPSNSEMNLIKSLKSKYGFGDFMINILIDYSIIVNDGAINKNYIFKIADTALKEGFNNPITLIQHLKISYKMKKNNKTDVSLNSKKEMKDKPIF